MKTIDANHSQSSRGHARPGWTHKLSTEEINAHPVAAYEGPIHVIDNASQVESALRALRRETLLGFDTETRPAFRKGEHYPPALLQMAGAQAVWLFRLSQLGLPAGLAQLLANPDVIKAGVSITHDVAELRRLQAFTPAGFVDLGHAAKQAGVQHHGLRGLAAVFLGCRISKSAQLTNWARPDLPARALQYAATDAWIGRRLYEAMDREGCFRRQSAAKPAATRPPQPRGLKALLTLALQRLRRPNR